MKELPSDSFEAELPRTVQPFVIMRFVYPRRGIYYGQSDITIVWVAALRRLHGVMMSYLSIDCIAKGIS